MFKGGKNYGESCFYITRRKNCYICHFLASKMLFMDEKLKIYPIYLCLGIEQEYLQTSRLFTSKAYYFSLYIYIYRYDCTCNILKRL